MTAETIDHSTLTQLVVKGYVNSAHIVAKPGGWSIQIPYGNKECSLAAQRSRQVRLFKRLETLVTYLQDIGITRFDVDTSNYDPLQIKTYTRPDRSEAMKQAHEAVAYEEWFKEQVQIGLDDSRPTVTDEEARRIFAAKRDAIRQRVR